MNDHEVSAEAIAKSRNFLDILTAFGWILLFFFLQLVGGLIALVYANWDIVLKGDQAAFVARATDLKAMAVPTIWGLAGSSIVTTILLWLYLRRNGRMEALGLNRWSRLSLPRTLIWSVALVSAGLAFNAAYSEYVIPHVKVQDQLHQLLDAVPETHINKILLLFTIAILAPITEELIFRGLLQKSLSNWAGPAVAIVIASAVFASVHLDLYAFPALFALGSVFGILYHKTGSMRVNILMHVINNAAATLLT